MKYLSARGMTGNIAFVFIPDSATGLGKTALTNASAGLKIAVRREKSAAMTVYTGGNVGTIVTLGTWVDPGAGKCNFAEVDAANAAGLYEIHFRDSLFDASDTSRRVIGMVQATGVAPTPFEISLSGVDLQDSVRAGITALPNVAAGAQNGVPVLDANLELKVSTLRTNNDKTGYALTIGEHTGIAADTQAGLSAQGYSAARAARLDDLDAAISSRVAVGAVVPANVIQWNSLAVPNVPQYFDKLALTADGWVTAGNVIGDVGGDVHGKLLGNSFTPIVGAGAQADVSGSLNAQGYTAARAAYLDALAAAIDVNGRVQLPQWAMEGIHAIRHGLLRDLVGDQIYAVDAAGTRLFTMQVVRDRYNRPIAYHAID